MNNDRVAANFCSGCDVLWPDDNNYRKCPVCEKQNERIVAVEGLSFEAAKETTTRLLEIKRLYVEFEDFYVDREVAALLAELDSPLC